jgi:trans-L-3-hydroxyproline dehydratase
MPTVGFRPPELRSVMTANPVLVVTTDDLHTGGEPVRIVTSGYPPVHGKTILEKRTYVAQELDHIRRFLMWEPRGHRDMYGVIPVEPDHPGAALAVLFMHNEGYSTMCGHATIALGRWAIETGRVAVTEPVTSFLLQCPCGPVEVAVEVDGGVPGRVSFRSVPSFALALDRAVDLPGIGRVRYDVAYGGAFYAFTEAAMLGTRVDARADEIVARADAFCGAVRRDLAIVHPDEPALGFLYGAILTDGEDGAANPSANVCVFADRQIDRSPTGSGVTARVAIAAARGLPVGSPPRRYRSITGAVFEARPVEAASVGSYPAVVVEVTGEAYWTGRASFVLDPADSIGAGFILR